MKIQIYFPLFTMSDLHFLIEASGLSSGINGFNCETIQFIIETKIESSKQRNSQAPEIN